jgi:hypothetical protein
MATSFSAIDRRSVAGLFIGGQLVIVCLCRAFRTPLLLPFSPFVDWIFPSLGCVDHSLVATRAGLGVPPLPHRCSMVAFSQVWCICRDPMPSAAMARAESRADRAPMRASRVHALAQAGAVATSFFRRRARSVRSLTMILGGICAYATRRVRQRAPCVLWLPLGRARCTAVRICWDGVSPAVRCLWCHCGDVRCARGRIHGFRIVILSEFSCLLYMHIITDLQTTFKRAKRRSNSVMHST